MNNRKKENLEISLYKLYKNFKTVLRSPHSPLCSSPKGLYPSLQPPQKSLATNEAGPSDGVSTMRGTWASIPLMWLG
ncbi:hypothetical protein ES288_A01G200900v1 [Gossypium darwinii]|uniref:Uncharacterized protein n=1 Tax=Gossypium darwinii TaxID=34276 RepID=A0A5D2HNY8_GOSDA|nr:hypothetical protein ES288_A01G200900v1 [Gossypium darwinii]